MKLVLNDSQLKAINSLKSGAILNGGVGSGKSRTSLAYFFIKECRGCIEINGRGKYIPMEKPKDLYIITTAKKRDSLEWEKEAVPFLFETNNIIFKIDSWNNIEKYVNVKDAFFIFDEQRLIGSGKWVKTFLKIVKSNNWILLTATPGDVWIDYAPVFIANGFYKNRTDFIRQHVIFNSFLNYPKIDRYVNCRKLIYYKNLITVNLSSEKQNVKIINDIKVGFDKKSYLKVVKERWNIFEDTPIKNASEFCFTLRKIVNSDPERLDKLKTIFLRHKKVIVFYNFNYELDMLEKFCEDNKITYSQWNGHKHEEIPNSKSWLYLVQYTSGCEGWNCIVTNCIFFYSQNPSYRVIEQASGRIDRMNTPFEKLYYYFVYSDSTIDKAIIKNRNNKKRFNETEFAENCYF